MRIIHAQFITSVFIAAVIGIANCAEFTLSTPDGSPLRDIVIAPDAPDSVKFAAKELSEGLSKRTGAAPKLHEDGALLESPAIYLGVSEATQKFGVTRKDAEKPQSFTIRTLKNGLAIFGKDYGGPPIVGVRDPWHEGAVLNKRLKLQMFGDCGTLDGVHHFMQKYLGFRWYMPGEIGEVVPPAGDVALPHISETVTADFAYRYPYFCWFGRSDEGTVWFKRLRFGGSVPLQLNHIFKNAMFWESAKGHPEYFALVDGERDEKGGKCSVSGPQYCLTNPDVVKLFADGISKYFDEHPEMTTFPVCPGDGLRRVCECPNCSKEVQRGESFETGGFSYHIWNFVNKVAREVRKTHPDKFIVGAAYHQHGDCPDIQLEPNVMVLITKRRSGYVNPYYKEFNRKRFDDWNRKAPGRIFCWDYYLDTDVPWRNLPVQFTGLIAEDLRYMKGMSVQGEFIECSSASRGALAFPGMTHLNLYVTSQLFWDVNLDLSALLEEYYDLFYGPARAQMKEFWETAENRRNEYGPKVMNANARSIRTAMPPGEIYPPAVLKRMSQLMEEAVKATAAGSIHRRRVELVKSEFDLGAKALAAMMDIKAKEAVIDDKLGEYEEFFAKTGEPFDVKTGMAASIDADYLTLKFICQEPLIDKLDRRPFEKDNSKIWGQDGIEIFIVPDEGRLDKAYQLYVSASASIIDYERHDGRILSGYNINADANVECQPSRWLLTVRIPRKEVGLEQDRPFLANFFRYRNFGDIAKDKVHSCWSPTGEYNHFCPEKYGKFTIGAPRRTEVKGAEAIVRPNPPEDIAVGNTAMTFWLTGGSIGGKSPIVGNINGTRRNDIVLLHLPLGAFLEKGAVQKAVFSVKCTIYGDKQTPLSCTLESFDGIDGRLQRADLAQEGLAKVGDITVTAPDAGEIKTFDVTALVNDALSKGLLSLKFRFQDHAFTKEAAAGRTSGTHAMDLSDIKLIITP
ncbi:MAG: DUF4838 domain-containing protein [Victivallales bacterium]|nr:DUF4838 domain-containing protein [Victivallales bacterium]